jgi:hypothetical protein
MEHLLVVVALRVLVADGETTVSPVQRTRGCGVKPGLRFLLARLPD